LQVALVRFDFEIAELRLPEPHPCPWYPLIRIGLIAEEVVTRHWGPGALAEIVDEMLSTTDATLTLARLLKGQQYEQSDDQEQRTEPSLLPKKNWQVYWRRSATHLPETLFLKG